MAALHAPPATSAPRLFGAGGPAAPPTPYNAPTYFPPAYFAGGAAGDAASTPTLGRTPYNPPTYFPPAYFAGGAAGDAATNPTPGRTPYNPPTFFPPAYFYGGAVATDPAPPASGRTPYNPPTFFPPAYFYGGAVATDPVPIALPTLPGRDGACYAAIVALLEGSGRFDSVAFGDPSRAGAGGAADHPRAVVTPRGWEESDDSDPALTTRRTSFAIRITVRGDDGDACPYDELDRLAAEVQARVDGSGLGGRCVPPLTKIRAGRYQAAGQYPEWSVDLDGEFTTLDDPTAP